MGILVRGLLNNINKKEGGNMTQNIQQLDSSLLSIPLNSKDANKKSDEALAASLQKLEELFEVVATSEVSTKVPGAKSSNVNIDDIRSQVRATLLQNPEAFEEVITLIAPHVQGAGQKINDQFIKIREAFVDYQNITKNVSEEELRAGFDQVLVPAFANEGKSREALVGLYDSITPILEKLNDSDPSKLPAFLKRLSPILGMIALRNPSKAGEIFGDFGTKLNDVYNLDDSSQEEFFSKVESSMKNVTTESEDPSVKRLLTSYSSAGTANSPDMNGDLGLAMLFLQQFQVALSKCQADQGTLDATISSTMIKSAEANQEKVTQEVNKVIEEVKKASRWAWLGVVSHVLAALVSVIAAVLAPGVGMAVAAIAVGGFMSSPAFNDAVQGIATIMPGPVGQVIAKVIVTAAIMAASCGAAGFGIATDAALDTAVSAGVEEGVEMVTMGASRGIGSEITEQVASVVAKTGGRVTWSLTQCMTTGVKLAAFEGVSTLTSSGIVMDIMSTDSSFVKNHPNLAMWLNLAAEAVGIIATLMTGRFAFKNMNAGGSLLERLSSKFKILIPLNWFAQAMQAGVGGGLSIQRAEYLNAQAKNTKALGGAEAELNQCLSGVEMMSDSLNAASGASSGAIKAIGDEINLLANSSGGIWKTTARLAAS